MNNIELEISLDVKVEISDGTPEILDDATRGLRAELLELGATTVDLGRNDEI